MLTIEVKLISSIFMANMFAGVYCYNNKKPLFCKCPLQYTIIKNDMIKK